MNNNTIDLTGKRFGKLLVLELGNRLGKDRGLFWLCKCDCGTIKEIRGSSLRNGDTKSCGCLAKFLTAERSKLVKYRASFNDLYYKYKESAKHRNLEFSISKEEFENITQQKCHYCGINPLQIRVDRHKKLNGDYIHNGVDRIDSSMGYIQDNVVACCKICNYAKRNMSKEDFMVWVKRIYEYNYGGM